MIRAVLLFSGLYDLETGVTRRFPGIRSDIEMLLGTSDIENVKNIETYSVLKNVTKEFPPTFVSSGEVDPLHPEAIELIKVLAKLHIDYQTMLFDKTEKKAFHTYQQQLDLLTAQLCMASVAEFLQTVVRR